MTRLAGRAARAGVHWARNRRRHGQAWAQAGVQGAGHWAQACVAGVRTGAQGVLALGVGAGACAADELQRRRGAQASGTEWTREELAGARQSERARGRGWQRRSGRTGARRRRRQGLAGGLAGRPVSAWVCSAGPDLGFVHSDSVFGPV